MSAQNAAVLAEIAAGLRAERDTILDSVRSLERDDADLVASRVTGEARIRNDSDGDTLAVERHLVASLGATVREALAEVEAALSRIAEGTYGLCTGCGQQIPWERLEVRPRTATCVPCAGARR